MIEHDVRPVGLSDVAQWSAEADVVIVGYGCAGASAALDAHAGGGDVVILEMLADGGGSSGMSGGQIYLGGGTPVQSANGYGHDSWEGMATYLKAALGPNADHEKIDIYARDSRSHYDWLTGHGVPFKPTFFDEPVGVPPTDDGLIWLGENAAPFTDLTPAVPRGHLVQAEGHGGKVLMHHLKAAVAKTNIRVEVDTRALRLVLDGDRVVGVVARKYGQDRTFRAHKGVILTTGGFIDNHRMVAQHLPQLVGLGTNSDGNDNGSGILMGQAVGGGVRHMGGAQVGIPLAPGLMARGMVVNDHGKRFINEDCYPGRVGQHALFGHGLGAWVIIDEKGFEATPEGTRQGARLHHVAETVEELESLAGFPSGSLVRTVEEYNANAEQGHDPVFGKNPKWVRKLVAPFAAIDIRGPRTESPESGLNPGEGEFAKAAAVFSLGGLHTSIDGEVYDLMGVKIPGLYAAGRASSGVPAWGYVSGTSLGDGTYFGRRAGRAALVSE